jgi:hypothetical protein
MDNHKEHTMAEEVKKAVIQFLNNEVRSCKTDEDFLRLAGKFVAKNTSRKKLFEKLGLAPVEEVKPPESPEDGTTDED